MHNLSSPVVYPPSSSPDLLVESRKRFSEECQPAQVKRRLVERALPLSWRSLNRQDTTEPQSVSPATGTTDYCTKKIKARGPFVDTNDRDDISNPRMLSMLQSVTNTPTAIVPALSPTKEVDAKWTRINNGLRAKASAGRDFTLRERNLNKPISYEQLVAERSSTKPGKPTKSFYGIDMHDLLNKITESSKSISKPATVEIVQPSIELPPTGSEAKKSPTMMWTEKYRARKFADLVGDERTHREVLRWLKSWDPVVFPGNRQLKRKAKSQDIQLQDQGRRKVLLLTGPPGLGKTTLAHVCARQAGYEVVEINASDERSRDVVNGRIRDSVGTENVKGINVRSESGTTRRPGRPVCIIVDEVDGVVAGSSAAGEGGFIKALVELIALDQKNSDEFGKQGYRSTSKRSRRKDQFRLLRPIVLICNDLYSPALRPLRSSAICQIIHVRRPPLEKVNSRLKIIFEKEGIPCDGDGVRRLCEAAWGVCNTKDKHPSSSNAGEGDIRGVLVAAEWVATRLRNAAVTPSQKPARLTRKWMEQNLRQDLDHHGDAARTLGRGGVREIAERVFKENAGFSKSVIAALSEDGVHPRAATINRGVSEATKSGTIERLRNLVEASGECDRIMTDCFANYASYPIQDDTLLTKPNAAYDWLHFHDSITTRVSRGQEWELSPYLSQSTLAFHHLFASPLKPSWNADQPRWEDEVERATGPFSGLRADYEVSESCKQNRNMLQAFQGSLSIQLLRSFRAVEDIVTGLIPYMIRVLNPEVKPVVVGGSGEMRGVVSVRKEGERAMVQRAVHVMSSVGIIFERSRINAESGDTVNYVYRMEPSVKINPPAVCCFN